MNKNKNFFDELDTTDWADILSNTYEKASPEHLWKEIIPHNNRILDISVVVSDKTISSLDDYENTYIESYPSSDRDIVVKFKLYSEKNAEVPISQGVLIGMVDNIKLNKMLSVFEINFECTKYQEYGTDLKLDYMSLNKRTHDYNPENLKINYNILHEFLENAIDKLNEKRDPDTKITIQENILILNELKKNTANILD